MVLHYEWLLLNPESEVNKICSWLGLQFSSEMIDYGRAKDQPVWRYGDQNKVYQDTKPDSQNLDKWIMALDNPQVWRIVNDYLEFLLLFPLKNLFLLFLLGKGHKYCRFC